jgi:K+-sensing histidine kinase KdpD
MQPRDTATRVQPAGGVGSGHARSKDAPNVPGTGPPRSIGEHDREVFLDILSHELRTPVTTIYGGAQLLASKELTPERRMALATDIRSDADRLYRLVEDLVVLARSERDEIHPMGEPIALGRLVTAAVHRAMAVRPDVEIRVVGANGAAVDGADEILVTHVLRNLIDNAIRYGAAAGPIEVVVTESEADVEVRVLDLGAAPSPNAHPFALSTEAPATAAGRSGGGIGLYVAYRLMDAMHGRMWAVPSSGSGAEFGFALARSATAPLADA